MTKLPTDESRKRTWILSRGKLHELPDGSSCSPHEIFALRHHRTVLVAWQDPDGHGPFHPAKKLAPVVSMTRRLKVCGSPHGP